MLKSRDITAVFTSLRNDDGILDELDRGLSSLMDCWVKLIDVEANGEINRSLYVIKSRGMSHSNQVREYRMGANGIELIEPYIGPAGVLTGTARVTQVAQETAAHLQRQQDGERRQRDLARRRHALERQIAEMRAALDMEEQEAGMLFQEDGLREAALESDRLAVAARRSAAE